jgi:hypothetical protein
MYVHKNLFNLKKKHKKDEYLSNSEKFYVLVWNLKLKKPEFKIRFRHKIKEMVIRSRLVFFVLENRLSIFERNTLTHILKLPIKSPNGKEEKIKSAKTIKTSTDIGIESHVMLFLPEDCSYLLFLQLDECLDMKLDYVAQRKRVLVQRRVSRVSTSKVNLKGKGGFLEEKGIQTPAIRSFGKKDQAVMEDIEEGTDTDPEKDNFHKSSSVYFNSEIQKSMFPEKSMLCFLY